MNRVLFADRGFAPLRRFASLPSSPSSLIRCLLRAGLPAAIFLAAIVGSTSDNAAAADLTIESQTSVCAHQSIRFQAIGSGRTLATATWQFGDGSAESGLSVAHAFPRTGTFTVRVSAFDTERNSVEGSRKVTVSCSSATPTRTPAPAAVPVTTPTPVPTRTPTGVPVSTPTTSSTATVTRTPTVASTPVPPSTRTASPTGSPVVTPAATPTASPTTAIEGSVSGKILLHFGWDVVGPKELLSQVTEMESSTPFGGIVFKVPLSVSPGVQKSLHQLAFGKARLDPTLLAPQLELIRRVPFQKFTDNFLRYNMEPGDVDWFDTDFDSVIENAKLAARFARDTPNCKGIFFDTEPYQGQVLTYLKRPYNGTKTLEQYGAQVKRRAVEWMNAVQAEFPDITIIVTHGYEKTINKESASTKVGKLLPFFLDGLYAAAGDHVVIVQGFEKSYSFKSESQFDAGRRQMLSGNLALTREQAAYQRHMSAAFAFSIDWPHKDGAFSVTDFTNNFFTPAEVRNAVTAALRKSDRYVWLYGQKDAAWFPVKTLPDSYSRAVKEALHSVATEP